MASIPELTLLVSASFIGSATVINVIKKNLISCNLLGCKCDFQQIPESPRSLTNKQDDGFFTTRQKEDLAEIEQNTSKFEKARNSLKDFDIKAKKLENLKKEKIQRSKSLN